MRLTVKQPLPFWFQLKAVPFFNDESSGSSVTLTEDSHFITRITGADFSDSYVIEWEVLHPNEEDSYTATFVSSNEDVVTVDATGTLTAVSTGEVTIAVTVTRSSDGLSKVNSIPVLVNFSAGSSIDYIDNANGSVGKAFDDNMNALISGESSTIAKPRFSSRNLSTKTFTRNTDFWGVGLNGLSGISPNNSRNQNKGAGTAITKRHIISTAHYPLKVGDTIDFVEDASGTTVAVTRTIVQVKTHPLYRGQSGGYCYDIQVCLLDSDLPSEIDFIEVMPSNSSDYTGEYAWIGTTGCAFDQEQKGLSTLHGILSQGVYYGSTLVDHWFSHLNPQSMLTGVKYKPTLLGYSSPSDAVSPPKATESDERYTFGEKIIVGDSGAPNCFVLGTKLVLIGLHTAPDGGIYLPNRISEINQLILDVDTLAGISTGYTVTECDLSFYPTY